MVDDRKLAVLRAIVEDYVSTNEPVGSKALVERHHLHVSPATVRNDMAALEEEGYIAQPHTSAGRIPTEKGYRLFVDRIASVKPLSAAERRAIETFLDGAVDLDDVVRRTVRLLAQLTRQVAVVQYPSLSRATVRHVELVPLTETRVMLVAISDTGRVEQRMVDLPGPVSDATLSDLRARLNARISGRPLVDVPLLLEELPADLPEADRPLATALVSVVLEAFIERPEERVVLGGTANLTLSSADFPLTLRPVLEALEEQVVLLRLLGEAADPNALTVRIGPEHSVEALQSTSVVSTTYGADLPLGALGVVGPMRMDYPGSMATVRAVARYLGQIIGGR